MNSVLTAESRVEVQSAQLMAEGDGAEVVRLFPLRSGRMNYDPFVLFDHFFLKTGTGFPTHPHRGFEAITYLFKGGMQHKDNLGNDSTVTAGGAQRFTAGAGIEHSEMPDGKSTGIQLWINLPKALKMIPPDYQAVAAEQIAEHPFEGGKRWIIVGEGSPLALHTRIRYEDIMLHSAGLYQASFSTEEQGLIYVVEGEVQVEGHTIKQQQAAYFGKLDALTLTSDAGARLMLCVGLPHHEPIRRYGPYVD
ncbi:MAG: pirin family protein [Halobacteria archaeon]|nr:pirin family protein [Halobacteria archaeon]